MMIKYQYMSDAQADAIYGRLCREVSKLGRDIALYEAELKKVGKSLETTGHQLQKLNCDVDRPSLETEISALWEFVESYQKALSERAEKTAQLEKIDAASC
jgi:hypothetical protein